ncbi:protein piccolo-like isoform X4 [Thunnus thynnus]|uniref:protein piccolo-like isoform X4 n=1 Tax=Thunnus thynnus TaxID=8237 RepID=UPI0035272D1A
MLAGVCVSDIMSDLWTFSTSCPPPIIHHSSVSQSSPFSPSPPPVFSPSSLRNHGNLPHDKVNSHHLPYPQVSSPHLQHPQVTSPHLQHPQVTSPHLQHPQVTSPHLQHPQVTSPHLQHTQVTSPHLQHPQVTSPHLQHTLVTSPHHHHQHQVTSPHLAYPQVTSPHLAYPQVTSPHLQHPLVSSPHHHHQHQVTSPSLPHAQVTSPYLVPQSQESSPHHFQPQVTSPHLHQPQVTSPHLCQPQVTSPHLCQPQVTSPHLHQPQVTSPHLHQPQVTSPHLCQPQVTSPHHLLSSHNHDADLDHSNWSGSEPPSDLSYLLNNYSFSHQSQDTSYLDFHPQNQNQNQFNTDLTHHRPKLENINTLPYETQTLVSSNVYGQSNSPGPDADTWGSLEPALSQLQCSPLGSLSGGVPLGRRSSVEFRSLSAEDFSSNQFVPYSYHDSNATQPFCSPSTPGPSPHYPQTPAISSPGPQMHPRTERLGFQTQTSTQLNRDKTISCCLHESDSYAVTSDPSQHQLSQHVVLSQTEPIHNQSGLPDAASSLDSCFPPQGSGQDVGSAAQPPSLTAGLSWREESGGGRKRGRGRGRGRGGGGDSQPDLTWNWIKQPQHENLTKAPDSRLMCTVCKRDFRSLPALNGHMRSHSGFRSATWLNKGNNSSPPVQPSVSMVIPVSVPVQSKDMSKVCRSGQQRRCTRQSSATGGAVLYCSLMRLDTAKEEEETVARGGGKVASGGGDDSGGVVSGNGVVARGDGGRGHYTPPPMLCPLRAGPGLYCSLTTRRQQRAQTVQLHNSHNGLSDLVSMETAPPSPPGTLTTGINKPRINMGRGYQAEIPPLQDRKYAPSDSHDALLLWTPWDVLERPANQQRVEALLSMSRSSVVPGGGASPEHALHILSEARGDFLVSVEKLLSTPETSDNSHSAGVMWSEAERKLMVKSLQLHQKDFSSVQKAVQTKSVSQCVEFYYLWKKKLSLSSRTPAGLTVALPNKKGQRS